MPSSLRGPCSVAGCPALSWRASGKCERHNRARARQHDAGRPSSTARGYDAAWDALRRARLDAEPYCRACLVEGRSTRATDLHHAPAYPTLGRDHELYDLIPLCHPHHSAITRRAVATGYRRRP